MHKELLKPLSEFINNHLGCQFVGISDEGEVFISFENDDPDIQTAVKSKIKERFEDQISSITTVVQTRLEDLQTLVEGLNQALAQQEEESKSDLLDIGNF